MNRRGFLSALGAATVAAADPGRVYSFLGFGKPKWKIVTGDYVASVQIGEQVIRASRLTTFDAILKQRYSDAKIDALIYGTNPLLAMVSGAR